MSIISANEKVRVVLFLEDISFVYNYGAEMPWAELLDKIDAKKEKIVVDHAANRGGAKERFDAAFRFLYHIRSVFTKSGKMKHRMGYTYQTDMYLEKNIHLITGMSLQYIIEDGVSNLAFLTGDDVGKKLYYAKNPEAKKRDIEMTKERVFDSLLLLSFFQVVNNDQYTIQIFPEEHFGKLASISFCCNVGCSSRWEKSTTKQLVCAICKTASYCSKECQKIDWVSGGHRRSCKSIVKGKKKAVELNSGFESIRHFLANGDDEEDDDDDEDA